MNGKKRWRVAIALSLIINILLFVLASRHISLLAQNVQPQPPVTEIFVEDTPEGDVSGSDEEDTGDLVQSETDVRVQAEDKIVVEEPINDQKVQPENNTEPPKKVKKRPTRTRVTGSTTGKDLSGMIDLNKQATAKVLSMSPFNLPEELVKSSGLQLPIKVTVIYIIEADGTVQRVDIKESSGDEMIDDIAVETIMKWRYEAMEKEFPVSLEQEFVWPIDAK